MEEEIKKTETHYQNLINELKENTATQVNTLMNGNGSKPFKNHYYYEMRKRFVINLQQLENNKKLKIQEIKNKYNPRLQPAKFACLIGINYQNTSSELHGCVNDVLKLRNILQTKLGYKSNNIMTLTNNQGTRNNILANFARLLQNSIEGDTLFFSFSGHGAFTKDLNSDEDDGRDEFIVCVDNKSIIDDEFKIIIDKYLKPNVKLFALFDNCHSGTILDLPYQYIATDEFKTHNSTDTKGEVICLSGCRDNQVSMDAYIKGTFNGAMTWALSEVLSTQEKMTWNTCLSRLRSKLKQRGFKQLPQLTCGTKLDFTDKFVDI
tara:strand:- start:5097 stop:6059 length:963 start_codon:yes stop_codon:yes gene_type:complete